jgi:hypothetical protein
VKTGDLAHHIRTDPIDAYPGRRVRTKHQTANIERSVTPAKRDRCPITFPFERSVVP